MAWWKRAFGDSRRAPDDVDAALRGALLHVLDRELDQAERLLEAACQLDSSGVEPYLALAKLYRMRGEIGRAIRVHQNLLLRKDLEPEQQVAALADLAADFRRGGFLQRSIAAYEEVIARQPRHREALGALVWLLADARDYERAIEMAQRLAKVDREAAERVPDEAALRVDSAEAALAQGRNDEARRAAKRALRRDPGSVRGWIALGEIEAARGKTRAALSAWQRVPRLDRSAGRNVYPRIEATYAAQGRLADFESWLRKLLEERPDDDHARLALARALAARGESVQAQAELQRLLEKDPDSLPVRAALGRVLLTHGGDGEVAKAYGELIDVLERQGLLHRRESLR
jgi:lipopolysaccharide biosynthesis regulator YciM